jgi:hypothetical protein
MKRRVPSTVSVVADRPSSMSANGEQVTSMPMFAETNFRIRRDSFPISLSTILDRAISALLALLTRKWTSASHSRYAVAPITSDESIDTRRLKFPGAHHLDHAGLHRRPNFFSIFHRKKHGLEGIPRLSVGSKCRWGTVFEEASFLEEGFKQRFQHEDFRNQRLYELQLEFLSLYLEYYGATRRD